METNCYRSVDGVDLGIDVFRPAGAASGAILFFHGGGWRRGDRTGFHHFCEVFAAKGLVTASASYRLFDREPGGLQCCIDDARAAMAWMRSQADALGFPADKLAAGGGSAGGHLAACCAMIPSDCWPATRPDALLLFNPVVDNGPGQFGHKRIGDDYHRYSPLHRVSKGCPPCCFLLGTEDVGLPITVGLEFQKRIQDVGGRCDLHLYGGQAHGFFQPEREGGRYHECLASSFAFLQGLGFLPS